MSNKFAKVALPTANRSKHDLSAPHITTTDFGRIDVVYHTQLFENDDLSLNIVSQLRAAPMPQPTMGRIFLNVRAFFVPNRILCDKSSFDWDLWRNNLSNATHPYIREDRIIFRFLSAVAATHKRDCRRLIAQLGFPKRMYNATVIDPQVAYYEKFNPFAIKSYNRIWWDWYRDSNLIDDSQFANYVTKLVAGYNEASDFEPRYCCYPKDYFTTAKVNPQENSGSVNTGNVPGNTYNTITPSNPNNVLWQGSPAGIQQSNIPIQFLRAANSLQRYLERNNIAGGRVMARFYARFGVTPDSVRLDQSEYVGGFTCPLGIGDVTSPMQNDGQPLTHDQAFISDYSMAGEQAGKGFLKDGGYMQYHAVEDGTFMVLASLVPEVFYFEGMPADLLRGANNVKEDYFTPEFEGLGYEPILKKQVAANRNDLDGTAGTTDNQIFGFQPRYSNYKFKLGTISGDMSLTETMTGMQGFNLFRILAPNGVSGADLLPGFTMILPEDRHSFDRIFNVPGPNPGDFDHFWGCHWCDCQIVRDMSAHQLPQLEEDSHSNGKVVTIDNGGVRM